LKKRDEEEGFKMDELTNHYFSKEVSGYLTIDHLNQLSGVAKFYVNSDFKIMIEQNLCGVYATFYDSLVYAVFGGGIYKDYMSYTNETEEFTDFEPIGRN
jgi:hypothetical protein